MRYVGHSLAAAAAIAALGTAAPTALAQAPAQAATVIVLNYEQLVRTSVAGRDLQAKLAQIRTAAENELQPEATAIETERQRIATATQGMNEEQVRANTVLMSQIQALSTRADAWQQRRTGIAHDLQCTEQTAVAHFNELITPTVRQVMTERGAGIVIDRQAANLVLPDFDATSRVLSLIDQSVRSVGDIARTPASTCEGPAQGAAPAAAAAPTPAPTGNHRRRNNN
jgi:Skp family chaperone for outer membrane proteins